MVKYVYLHIHLLLLIQMLPTKELKSLSCSSENLTCYTNLFSGFSFPLQLWSMLLHLCIICIVSIDTNITKHDDHWHRHSHCCHGKHCPYHENDTYNIRKHHWHYHYYDVYHCEYCYLFFYWQTLFNWHSVTIFSSRYLEK